MYQSNESLLDRFLRLVLAEIFFILAWFWLSGPIMIIAYVLVALMLFTAATGFCALYKIFKINTKPSVEKRKKLYSLLFSLLFLVIAVVGSYYSLFFTKKFFLEDYNRMNDYYKQALFNTGQEKRAEAIVDYDGLTGEYQIFINKYRAYQPQALARDANFVSDLEKIDVLIKGLHDEIYDGDLKVAHTKLEEVRPIFQDILKRNSFSMLAVALVDFHDSMEEVIAEADNKNADGVISTYAEASVKLQTIESEANDVEIQVIRNNLETLLQAAKTGQSEDLPAKAASLKSSFIKVYLQRG